MPTLEDHLITCEMQPSNIDESLIRTQLKRLNTNKTPGPDQISPELADSVAVPLTLLFSHSLRFGGVPDE